ncbi:MAG: hypothetical protein ACRDOC_15545 [Streptosporangiaceae bacterium]
MFPVAAIAGAGWLFLFVVLLIVPPSPGPHEGGGQGEGRTARKGRTRTPHPGDVPPAMVSLLARQLERSGFGATLVDLAARGWFEVRAPAGPGGPALCVVPAETPGGPLTPFERRVVAHVALRAGVRGEVPAALGAAPAALAVFAQGSTNVAWSSYRGSWQLLEIETNTWSWPRGCAISVAIALGPVLYFATAIWLGTHGMVLLAEEMTGLIVAAGIAGGLAALARRAAFPRVAEFDGQVIRQWMVRGDSDSEDEYHVAIDDGTRDKAWDLSIGTERYRRLPPGTFVHARVNLRSRADVTVEPVEPPAVAQPLARVAADQERAVTNGLPDPADLVLEAEAAAILGGKVRGSHPDGAPGRTMVWQPPSTARPMLRVEVRHAADARRVPPTARAAPGVADGYFVRQGAAVTVSALTALISIHGSVHIAAEASLAGLLPVVEGRLRELARSIDFNQY